MRWLTLFHAGYLSYMVWYWYTDEDQGYPGITRCYERVSSCEYFMLVKMSFTNTHTCQQYMHENVRYSPSNWKVAQPTVEHLLSIYPRFLHGLVYKVLPALLDPLDVQGFGLTPASKSITRMVDNGLLLQAWIVRHLKLPRFKPTLRTPTKPDKNTNRYKVLFDIYKPVYPDGYCIHELGPDKFKPAKCPIAHWNQ